ncbi:acyltransferase family protein, partial [Klebsiella pneumoniae]
MSERNGTIDILKLLASFCIISVHIGYYQDYPVIFADLFRVSTRWALPFFFVSSGYFLGLSSNTNVIQRVNKLITIFLTASIFYSAVLLL